ncbi:YciI family protein [Dactylosporangium sp. CA-139114]|uniref:YciI family protein n=1 Tax=Dactylosporangium sp. CA-139114 TaxID=3239931 RepID=UPI003D99C306|nr:YciI family protein [Dactylosporangium thailandense]
MRYMMMHKLDDSNPALWQPTPAFIERFAKYMDEVSKAGVLLAAEGLLPSSAGAATISKRDGETTVVDGPFAEAKEVIGGFGIVQVRDQAEAVEWARRFADLFDHDIEIEVRRVSEYEG